MEEWTRNTIVKTEVDTRNHYETDTEITVECLMAPVHQPECVSMECDLDMDPVSLSSVLGLDTGSLLPYRREDVMTIPGVQYSRDLSQIEDDSYINTSAPNKSNISQLQCRIDPQQQERKVNDAICDKEKAIILVDEGCDLVQIERKNCSYYKHDENAIGIKPLSKSKNARAVFYPGEELENADQLQIFLRRPYTGSPVKYTKGINSNDQCVCFKQHPNSAFCVRLDDDSGGSCLWDMEVNPTALLRVTNLNYFKIKFSALALHSDVRKHLKMKDEFLVLVFRVQRGSRLMEQVFYIKVISSITRDYDTFTSFLIKNGFICQKEQDFSEEKPIPSSSIMKVWKENESEEDHKKLLQVLKEFRGSGILSYKPMEES